MTKGKHSVTEGPRTLRKYAAAIAVATLVVSLSMVGVQRAETPSHLAGKVRALRTPLRSAEHRRPSPSPSSPRQGSSRPVDCSKIKCIALTFDDGPVKDTARLLRILRERGVRVTFFLVGQNVTEFPEMVRQELADGHELGNHTWDHSDLIALSEDGVRSQIERTQNAVKKAAGVTPEVFRPPYGNTDAKVAAVARRFGLPQFLWEVDPLDWRDRNSAIVERRVVKDAAPGDIVLMHDIHPTTVTAVPDIIDRLAKEGFTFVTVSELFAGKLTPGAEYTRLEPSPAPTPTASPVRTVPRRPGG
jgi:peptidoglycan/xylan/chitin deacetylase (PgdA/CDA1 family)